MSHFQVQFTAQDECALCQDFLVDPVYLIPCNHLFCLDCFSEMHFKISDPPCPICRKPTRSLGYVPDTLVIEVYSSFINTGEADDKYAHAWFNVGCMMLESLRGNSDKSFAEAYQKMPCITLQSKPWAPLDVLIKAVEINKRFGKAWARIAQCLHHMELKEFTKNDFRYEIVACLEAAVANMTLHSPDTWNIINMIGGIQESITLNGHAFSKCEVLGKSLSGIPFGERYSHTKIPNWAALCAWMDKQSQKDISLVESVGGGIVSDASLTVQTSLEPSVLIDGKKHGRLDCTFAILTCFLNSGMEPDGAIVENLIERLELLGIKTHRDPYGESVFSIVELKKMRSELRPSVYSKIDQNAPLRSAMCTLMEGNTVVPIIEKAYKFFAEKNFHSAQCLFHNALGCMNFDAPYEKTTEGQSLMCALRLNVATCLAHMQLWEQARYNCMEALKIEPTNVKAVYRLVESLIALRRPEEAKPWVVHLEQSPLASDLPLVAEFREEIDSVCRKEKKSSEHPAVVLTPALWIPGELLEDAIKVSKKNAAKLLAEEKAEKEKKSKKQKEKRTHKK